jgi:monoamine oxidase
VEPDFLSIVENGLERGAGEPKRVVVVGAGMAGLVAAFELQRAGHEPLILEARQRVGGRIYTMREPFAEGLHAEAGAMRIPRSHDLTWAYVKRFDLKTYPFTMGNPKAYSFMRGERHIIADVQEAPELLGFTVAEHEHGKSPSALWADAIAPLKGRLEREGDAAWSAIRAEYDQYSTREFLEANGWSEGMIELYGLLSNQESRMNASFMELLRADMDHVFDDMVQVEGGSDHLPRAFLPDLKHRIRYGARMTAIDQSPESVTIHYQTRVGRASVTADYAIVTVPFSVLRHVEVLKPFSSAKQKAIRQLHYDASGKVFLQFRRRFWEEDDGIFGGGSITDLAVRNVYYPEHGRETGRGVVIGSYTWGEDAQRWGWLHPNDRVAEALEDVAKIHPQAIEEFEVGASHMWHTDEFAGGAFVLFDPGQETLLHDAIVAPEGRVYFAGEHASLSHRWIQGAVESGLRAAYEVHAAG